MPAHAPCKAPQAVVPSAGRARETHNATAVHLLTADMFLEAARWAHATTLQGRARTICTKRMNKGCLRLRVGFFTPMPICGDSCVLSDLALGKRLQDEIFLGATNATCRHCE